MNFWPTAQPNEDFIAAPIDPGWGNFLGAQIDDAWRFSAINSLARSVELGEASLYGTKLSAEEANKKYGIAGKLIFDSPVSEVEAQIMRDRKHDEMNQEFIIGSGSTSFGRSAGGFTAGLITSVLDPVNLASSFIPVVGEIRYARMLERFGNVAWKARLLKGSIEAGVGNALVEPFVLLPAMQEQANYGLTDSAINLGFGTIVGAGMHVAGGAIGDMFKRVEIAKELKRTQDIVGTLRPEERDAMFAAAIRDVLNDDPVWGPKEVSQVTEGITTEQARFDAAEARKQVVRELGFDTDRADTFNLYPDKSIADPKPNEPWYHGRDERHGLEFDRGNVGWFTREIKYAEGFGDTIFVANIETKKVATDLDVLRVAKELNLTENVRKEYGDVAEMSPNAYLPQWGHGPEENYKFAVVEELKRQGFDSALIHDDEGIEALVVFSPEQIRTPGSRSKKTKNGVKFSNAGAQQTDLAARVQKLKDARVKALVDKKRRDFKKKQQAVENARKVPAQKDPVAHAADDAVAAMDFIDKNTKEVMDEFGVTKTETETKVDEIEKQQAPEGEEKQQVTIDDRTEEQKFEDSLVDEELKLFNEVLLEVNVGGDKSKADYVARRIDEILHKSERVFNEYNGGTERNPAYIASREKLREDLISAVTRADPTPQNKYREWLLRRIEDSPGVFLEDVEKINRRLTEFDAIKKTKLFTGEKDINKYKTFSDLAEAMDKAQGITSANKGGIDLDNLPKGAELVARADEFSVVRVTDAEAMKKLAKDTDWCVTDTSVGESYLAIPRPDTTEYRDNRLDEMLAYAQDVDEYLKNVSVRTDNAEIKSMLVDMQKRVDDYTRGLLEADNGRVPYTKEDIGGEEELAAMDLDDLIRAYSEDAHEAFGDIVGELSDALHNVEDKASLRNPFNLILKGNKPFALVHEASGQFKDVHDSSVDVGIYWSVREETLQPDGTWKEPTTKTKHLFKTEGSDRPNQETINTEISKQSRAVEKHLEEGDVRLVLEDVLPDDVSQGLTKEDAAKIRYLLDAAGVENYEQVRNDLSELGVLHEIEPWTPPKEPGNIRKIYDFVTGKSDTVELNFGKERGVDIAAKDAEVREKGIGTAIDCILGRLM